MNSIDKNSAIEEQECHHASCHEELEGNIASTYMACGIVCSSYGCWKKCRRPDGHSGDHQCDDHGGSS